VRRVLIIFVLLVFAALATTDEVMCADGCRSASTADRSHVSGACAFCGGVVIASAETSRAPMMTAVQPPEPRSTFMPTRYSPSIDRPPRLS